MLPDTTLGDVPGWDRRDDLALLHDHASFRQRQDRFQVRLDEHDGRSEIVPKQQWQAADHLPGGGPDALWRLIQQQQ